MQVFHHFFLVTCVSTVQFIQFNTPIFTNFEGWFGGYMSSHWSASDCIYKMYYQAPPHYVVRISAQIYTAHRIMNIVYIKLSFQQMKDFPIYINLRIIYIQTEQKKTSFLQTSAPHTSDSAFIRIVIVTSETAVSTMGIKDLKVEFLECPVGCQMCNAGDTSQCNLWLKLAYDLSGIELWNFNNDGWKVYGLQTMKY